MSKLYIQNLGMIVTNRCNLECKHCMRGGRVSKDMSDDVIEKTLEQVTQIGNLTICGGEVTLAVDTIEKILTYIIDNKIILKGFSTTINGTIYSKKLMRLLSYANSYIESYKLEPNVAFAISSDIFHVASRILLNKNDDFYRNLIYYADNPYFYGFRGIDKKLFREGRAVELDDSITVPMRPWPIVYSYLKKKDIYEVGPLVCVNPDGIVTECDASIENQATLYNYGSVLEESLEDICKRVGTEVHPLLWYRKTGKIMKKQLNYEK